MVCGLTKANIDLARSKARFKKNGVYKLRGFAYRTRIGWVTHLAYEGVIYDRSNGTLIIVGNYLVDGDSSLCASKALKEYKYD